jgi:hypothetical protein
MICTRFKNKPRKDPKEDFEQDNKFGEELIAYKVNV